MMRRRPWKLVVGLLVLAALATLPGCGASAGRSEAPMEGGSDSWDQLTWDEGLWARAGEPS